jgi:NADH-quinone oxidoreductase subunit C
LDKFEDIKALLITTFGEEVVLGEDLNCTPKALIIKSDKIDAVCSELFTNKTTYFDSLSCLTGLDNGPEKGTIEVVYNLYSIPYESALMLKSELPRDKPEISTVSHIWQTANWHEREAYDLIGIHFLGHPDLRRILMPGDWEGHPLQKDYVEPEKYRGMETVRNEEA